MSALLSPGLLLGLLVSVGYAALFHLWRGRGLRDLILFIVASVLGFGVGQFVGAFTQLPWLQIGEVHMVEATVGSWLALAVLTLARTPIAQES